MSLRNFDMFLFDLNGQIRMCREVPLFLRVRTLLILELDLFVKTAVILDQNSGAVFKFFLYTLCLRMRSQICCLVTRILQLS